MGTMSQSAVQPTPYELFGGEPAFDQLAREFYGGVADDEVLRPMYPEADLGPAQDRLKMFLEQYWGGPGTYSQQRGHPRLRLRHQPFEVTPLARDRWLVHMMAAVDTLGLCPDLDAALRDYLQRAAFSLVNTEMPVPFGARIPTDQSPAEAQSPDGAGRDSVR